MTTAKESWKGHPLEERYGDFDEDMATTRAALKEWGDTRDLVVLVSPDLRFHAESALGEDRVFVMPGWCRSCSWVACHREAAKAFIEAQSRAVGESIDKEYNSRG